MKQNKKELWLRLKAYQFEGLVPRGLMDAVASMFGGGKNASTKAFAAKIARKRGWSDEYALRVVEEYKKFVYLGLVSPANITPSDPIDRVWHQHILFSKGYRAFEQEVLKRDFDHRPELVHVDEQTHLFARQYNATLALYVQEFGVSPPEDIWGKPKFDPEEAPVEPVPEPLRTAREEFGVRKALNELEDPLVDLLEEIAEQKRFEFPEFYLMHEVISAPSDKSHDHHDSPSKGSYTPSHHESPSYQHDSTTHSHGHSHFDSSPAHSDGGGHVSSCSTSSCSTASCGSGGGD